MSKRRHKRSINRYHRIDRTKQRESRRFTKSSDLLLRDMIYPEIISGYLSDIEDLRRYRPERQRLDRLEVSGKPAVVSYNNTTTQQQIYTRSIEARPFFKHPDKVIVCKKRRRRREVLFARRSIGKGAKVSKIRKYTEDSDVRC